jgi:hypothetical protein
MRNRLTSFLLLFLTFLPPLAWCGGGITPEQIYQPEIKLGSVIATWEVLPDDNPLAEKNQTGPKSPSRTLMTLRKDGTCRVFNREHPMGADCMWTMEDHKMFLIFPGDIKVDFFIYGVKGEFMITRSPVNNGKDQLWSRVK